MVIGMEPSAASAAMSGTNRRPPPRFCDDHVASRLLSPSHAPLSVPARHELHRGLSAVITILRWSVAGLARNHPRMVLSVRDLEYVQAAARRRCRPRSHHLQPCPSPQPPRFCHRQRYPGNPPALSSVNPAFRFSAWHRRATGLLGQHAPAGHGHRLPRSASLGALAGLFIFLAVIAFKPVGDGRATPWIPSVPKL